MLLSTKTIVYAAILVINITTSAGTRHIRVPMPNMEFCTKTIELEFGQGEMLDDPKYSEEMYCKTLPKRKEANAS